MPEYYDYQRRDPNTEVNWAEVGANFSNIIKEEHRVREERKSAIKESTRQQQIQFDTAAMGDSSNMNNWTLDYADKGTKQLQMLTNLLESGDMRIKDFTNSRQNLSDGTEQLFDLAAGYQSEYKKKMARADCTDPSGVGCSSQIETDLMATVEGFGNFANSEALIDPQTSRVMVGFSKYNEDKKIWELDKDPNSLVGINSLNNRIKQEFNLYDMDSAVAAKKESTGKFEMMVKQTGTLQEKGLLLKYSDPRMRSKENIDAQIAAGYLTEADRKFLEAWDADTDVWLDGELAKPNVVSSLITNNLANVSGQRYSFTFDEDEAAADKTAYTILLKNKDDMVVYDWTTKNGKIQYNRAKEGLRTVLNGAMDHTVDTTVVSDATKPSQPSAATIASGREQEKKSNSVALWNSSYGASVEEMNSNMDAMINSPQGQEAGMLSAAFTLQPNGDLRFESTNIEPRKNRTGENGILIPKDITTSQWAKAGIGWHGEVDENKLKGGFTGKDFNRENVIGIDRGYDKLPVPEDPYQAANTFIRNIVTGDFGIDQSEEDFVSKFESKFTSLGFTTVTPNSPWEEVEIHHPNAPKPHIMYTNYDGKEGKDRQDDLRNWMTQFVTDEQANAWMKTGIGNKTKETEEERLTREALDDAALKNNGDKLKLSDWKKLPENKGKTTAEYYKYFYKK